MLIGFERPEPSQQFLPQALNVNVYVIPDYKLTFCDI